MLFSNAVSASDIKMLTDNQNEKPSYRIRIGDFQRQEEAEALQQKLGSAITDPILISHPKPESPYHLEIGPLNRYAEAHEVQSKVAQVLEPPQTQAHAELDAALPKAAKEAKRTWNLVNAEIRAVIAEVSRITGKNFIIDPRVQGKISIVSGSPISDEELYPMFLSMLQVSGYSAIPSGRSVKIVPNNDAKTLAPYPLEAAKAKGDEMLVEVVPVHYIPAEQLVPTLRPLMPQWSSITANQPANSLVISGKASTVRELAKIIKQVDTSSNSGIDIIPLKHVLAMDVTNTLKDLVKSQLGAGASNQTTLSADDRNNAILISGSRTDRLRLRLLIHKLDRPSPYGYNSNTQVVYLNYLRAEDLVPILAGIAQASFSGTVGTTIGTITRPALDSTNPASSMASGINGGNGSSSSSANNSNNNTPPPSAEVIANTSKAPNQNEGTSKPSVQIIAEPNTNSIIINAPITLIRTLKSVIAQLDIKPAQILIEALVAEINESDLNSLGIEWGSVDQKTLTNSTFRPGFAIVNSHTSLDQFQAQIYALAEKNKANMLSTPSVVVLDNRQAKILIGKQVSVASSSYPNNAGGTTTGSPYTTFDRVNVALHLYVRPQITRGDGIQMQIDQGNDTLDPSTVLSNVTNPVFNISAIVTSVHIESGDIIVLGGLSQDSLGNDSKGVPILEDIPGVGRLFQHNINKREKKVLMVFIRPIILNTEKNAMQVSGSKYEYVRQYQLDSLRDLENYDPRNKDIVMPERPMASLPRPFAGQLRKN